MKNKPLTKSQVDKLLSAWAKMNILCAYLNDHEEHPEFFTDKFDPKEKGKEIYLLLDSLVLSIPDHDD